MAWYSHLFKNFPEFVVVHTVKGFGLVSFITHNELLVTKYVEVFLCTDKPFSGTSSVFKNLARLRYPLLG